MVLNADGDAKRLILVALAEFSDQCEPGTLTPSCPFFVATSNGPACGEQCHDLLTEHGRGGPGFERIDLGSDLSAVRMPRPRARRGPSPLARPFDAAEAHLRERDVPTERKSVAALLKGLEAHLMTAPWHSDDPDDRAYVIRASLDELRARGLDTQSILRDGFGPRIAATLAVLVAWPDLTRVDAAPPMSDHGLAPVPPEWTAAVFGDGIPIDDAHQRILLALGATNRLLAWVDLASEDDLIGLTPPQSLPDPAARRVQDRTLGAWIVDRFCETYLTEWRKDALRAEYEYLHHFRLGCCPAEVMAERRVEEREVAVAISDIAVEEWSDEDSDGDQQVELSAFTSHAIDRLVAGDLTAATAMCRALVQLRPTNGRAHNNFGFCLIPDDPMLALDHLEQGHRLGFTDDVNLANRVLCLLLLDRRAEAESLALRALSDLVDDGDVFVWTPGPEGLKFTGPQSVHYYLEELLALARLDPTTPDAD